MLCACRGGGGLTGDDRDGGQCAVCVLWGVLVLISEWGISDTWFRDIGSFI